ncbi:hypothetical protein BZA77DRAFT_356686 [Pyronema omphalodes]|nr:hypothetical protein BZA77DRAFT_356686 [Pyronema omphalodes]
MSPPNNDSDNPYHLLSIPSTSTTQEIRIRFLTLAIIYHPDTAPQNLANQYNERFIKITNAYDCLMGPVQRRLVDADLEWIDREAQERRTREDTNAEAQRREEWLCQQAARAQNQTYPDASRYFTPPGSSTPSTAPPSYTSSPPRSSDIPRHQTYTYSHTAGTLPNERTYLFSDSNNGGRRPTNGQRRPRKLMISRGVVTCGILVLILTSFLVLCGIFFHLPAPYERRIAIIGAGPAGLSTAYHLSQSGSLLDPHIPHSITLFDSSVLLGGRSSSSITLGTSRIPLGPTTIPLSSSLLPIAHRLGIPTTPVHNGIGDLVSNGTGSFGVWDGNSWVYVESAAENNEDRPWWGLDSWLRYSTENQNMERELVGFRERRMKMAIPFQNLGEALEKALLTGHAETLAVDWLQERGIGEEYQREVLNSLLRARYTQNIGSISAFSALSAMDRVDSVGVDIASLWAAMAEKSGAMLRLGSEVRGIEKGAWGGWYVNSTSSPLLERYDAVVIAAPWGLKSLTKSLEHQLNPEDVPGNVGFVDQHITIFSSLWEISNDQFKGVDTVPGLILTTPGSQQYKNASRYTGRDGLGQTPFWVLSQIGETYEPDGRKVYNYKIISAEEISDDMIRRWLGGGRNFEHVWRGYQKNTYSTLLPNHASNYSKIQLDQNLWYTGSMEELTTGIDPAAMMGENTAALILGQWKKEGIRLENDKRRPVDEEEERRRNEERKWREEERKWREDERKRREEEKKRREEEEERRREEERKRKREEERKIWWQGFWERVKTFLFVIFLLIYCACAI